MLTLTQEELARKKAEMRARLLRQEKDKMLAALTKAVTAKVEGQQVVTEVSKGIRQEHFKAFPRTEAP